MEKNMNVYACHTNLYSHQLLSFENQEAPKATWLHPRPIIFVMF